MVVASSIAFGLVGGQEARAGVCASPGVVELARDEASGVVSAWLASGVRVHAKAMPEAEQVRISAVFAGGEMLETPEARGVASLIASAGLGRASHGGAPTVETDAELSRRGVTVTAYVMRDAIRLDLGGPAGELGWMLELLGAVAREPRIEAGPARAWRQAYGSLAERATADPMLRLRQSLLGALTSGAGQDLASSGSVHLDHLTAELASSWITRLVVEAPMEVAIVGALSWADAIAQAEGALAGLPVRARIAPGVRGGGREGGAVRAPARDGAGARLGVLGPTYVERMEGGGRSAVLVGFEGPGMDQLRELRAVTLAREVLSDRVSDRLSDRESSQHAWAALMPGDSGASLGLFALIVSAPSHRADQLVGLAQVELSRFASEGPTDAELATAKADVDRRLAAQLASPVHWAARLSTLTYRGQRLEDLTGARAAYESISPAEVRETFRAWMARGAGALASELPGDREGLLVVQVIGVEAD
ncbi:MAG: insulinase family protein [Phycisphaerales bacterium]|nr:MAG: insulinase family protein [Phycisphaerales bacterium]